MKEKTLTTHRSGIRSCYECSHTIHPGEHYYIYYDLAGQAQCLKCDESETFIALKVTEVAVALEHLPAIKQ